MARLVYGHVIRDGVKLHYYRTLDEKQPMVFLHGFADSGLGWGETALGFQNFYDVILMDARGHGLSDKPANGYGAEDRVADVVSLMQQLELPQVPLIGHSMGAETACMVAAQYPQLVKCLVLEEPPFLADENNELPENKAERVARAAATVEQYAAQSLDEIVAQSREDHPDWPDWEHFQWAKAKKNLSVNSLQVLSAPRPFWQSYFDRIKCPVLLLSGDKDAGGIVTRQVAGQITAFGKHISEVNFPGAGHELRRQRFSAYYDALRAFLRKHYPI